MSESLWGRLRRLLNAPVVKPKEPPPRRSSTSMRQPGPFEPQATPEPPRPSMKWEKQRSGPRVGAAAWVARRSLRQQVLIALGAVSLVAITVVLVMRLFVERRLPREVQGLWSTDAPAYAGHYLELRGRGFGYTTGDSTKTAKWHIIDRVHRSAESEGVLYRVEYQDEGEELELSFVHYPGPPEQLTLSHQRAIGWKRNPSNRSLMPQY